MTNEAPRWNHNLHYHPVIIGAVPERCQRALDVGCGEGTLTCQLRPLVAHVTGIDPDEASIGLAKAHPDSGDIDYLVGDFLTLPFEPASFDLITMVTSLHHMDTATALNRTVGLLRPGGVLAIVGVARHRYLADLPYDIAAAIGHRVHLLTKTLWTQPSPTVWPPPETFKGMHRLAAATLPGVRYRRHLLWRYSLIWTKPT